MADNIWEIEGLDSIEGFLEGVYDTAITIMEDMDTVIDPDSTSLEEIYITGEWGNINREVRSFNVDVLMFVDFEGITQPARSTPVDNFLDELEEGLNILAARDWEDRRDVLQDELAQQIPGFSIDVSTPDITSGEIRRRIGVQEGNTVFNLTTKQAIEQSEGVSFENLRRIPLEVLRGEEEPEEVEETEEPEEEQEEVIEETVEEVFEPTPDFPEVPPPIRDFAKSPNELEVPVGQKDTKTVEVRDMYPFEVIMATQRPSPPDIPFDARDIPINDVKREIGDAIRGGTLGTAGPLQEQETPATYPRTGTYIRNYLKFQGPSYALELHKELLTYTAYVNGIHGFDLRTGTYTSMRRYLKTLRQIGDMGLELIEEKSQQELAARGLSIIPDHPTIEGEDAPWLERKRYWGLVEENEDHPAWDDPFAFLEEMQEDGDQGVE